MNILLLNWRDPWHPSAGGAEIVTFEHTKAWVKAGHTVTWVSGGYYEQKKRQETIEGVQFLRFGGTLTIHLIVPLFVLATGKNYDVIVDEVHGIPFFAPLFTRTPVVAFIHEVADEIWDYMYKWPIAPIGKLLERWAFRWYRRCQIWTDASSTIDELVGWGIPREQCVAIPCPIIKQVQRIEEEKESVPTYIFVSRVVRMKGIEEVIKAFSFITREQKNARLWIVGKGEPKYIEELEQMVEEYGIKENVTFVGVVSEAEKYQYMSRAHLLLHASVKEGWGLVVLEAASVGTPAVVYNVEGLKDVVKHEKTGVVIQNNSPQDMAREAIKLFRDTKRYTTFQKNGKVWEKSLRWNTVTKQSLMVLSSVLKK